MSVVAASNAPEGSSKYSLFPVPVLLLLYCLMSAVRLYGRDRHDRKAVNASSFVPMFLRLTQRTSVDDGGYLV